MLLKKSLTEAVNLFLETLSRVSTSNNQLGFNVETIIEITHEYSSNFYKGRDADNDKGITVGIRTLNDKLIVNQKYKVYGFLELYQTDRVYVNLIVKNAEPANDEMLSPDLVESIKKIPLQRRNFPDKTRINVFMICPKEDDAESTIDIESKINSSSVHELISINKNPCSITNVKAIVEAICAVPIDTDVLVLTRGGGDKLPIQILDDVLIVEALRNTSCYKVIGSGHASDRLAIEMMFDHVSSTPTDIANKLINELEKKIKAAELNSDYSLAQHQLSEKDSVIKELKLDLITKINENDSKQEKITELEKQVSFKPVDVSNESLRLTPEENNLKEQIQDLSVKLEVSDSKNNDYYHEIQNLQLENDSLRRRYDDDINRKMQPALVEKQIHTQHNSRLMVGFVAGAISMLVIGLIIAHYI